MGSDAAFDGYGVAPCGSLVICADVFKVIAPCLICAFFGAK